jgi:hypothetical protein
MIHVSGTKWTPELDNQILEMRAQGLSAKRIGVALGLTQTQVEGRFKRLRGKPLPPTAAPTQAPETIGVVNLGQIIKQYDTHDAILRELAAIPPENVVEQSELVRRSCGSDRARFNRCVELHSEEFKNYRIQMKLSEGRESRWYWGRPEFITKVRSLVEKYQ